MAVTGAIIAGVGTIASIEAEKDRAEEAEVQRRANRAAETSRVAKEKRRALRERRIKQARLEVAAEATGVAESSGELATVGRLGTEFAANVGFQRGLQEARDVVGQSQIRSARAGIRSATGTAIAGAGLNLFKASGGFSSIFEPSLTSEVEAVFEEEGLF